MMIVLDITQAVVFAAASTRVEVEENKQIMHSPPPPINREEHRFKEVIVN